MGQSNSRSVSITLVTMACIVLVCITSSLAEAQINCSTLAQWSALPQQNQPQIQVNLQHVFCGVVKFDNDGEATHLVGFHSRPGGINPTTVDLTDIVSSIGPKGTYDLKWTSKVSRVGSHISTMFPDKCTLDQVVKSIVYAKANSSNCNVKGLPFPDFECGPSGPLNVDDTLCSGSNGTRFTIVVSLFRDNPRFINTGFPL